MAISKRSVAEYTKYSCHFSHRDRKEYLNPLMPMMSQSSPRKQYTRTLVSALLVFVAFVLFLSTIPTAFSSSAGVEQQHATLRASTNPLPFDGTETDRQEQRNESEEDDADEEWEEDLPTCGVYYYYHVSKDGGTSVMTWQHEVTRQHPERVRYIEFYEIAGDRDFTRFPWNSTLNKMNSIIGSGELPEANRWLSVHHHHRTPGLRFMMPTLRRWKAELEEQGCSLVLTTTLREPISRMKSLVYFNNIPREEFESFVQDEKESQLYYLLYNTCEPMDEPGVPPTFCDHPGVWYHTQDRSQEELNEVVGYLNEFDFVGKTSEIGSFISYSMKETEWLLEGDSMASPHALSSEKPYQITDEMLQLITEHSKSDLLLWDLLFGQQQ